MAHLIFDGKVGNHVAEEQAARISHEYFQFLCLSIKIEEEESEKGTCKADADEAEKGRVQFMVKVCESQQDKECQTGCQSVYAVNQIDSIDNEQNDKYGQ